MPIYALGDLKPDLPAHGRYWVAPDANLIGKVKLGEDVGIWFGCTLRGDNEWIAIGARSNVQEGTVMHTDPPGPVFLTLPREALAQPWPQHKQPWLSRLTVVKLDGGAIN